MTMSITIEEATTSLLDLLDRVSKGEEITILKDGQEIARLVPALPVLPPRVPGTAAGMITIAPDFDEPLPDDIMSDIYFTCDSVGDQGEISFLSMLWSCWHTIFAISSKSQELVKIWLLPKFGSKTMLRIFYHEHPFEFLTILE